MKPPVRRERIAHATSGGLFVASVEKAFRVLELFGHSKAELGLSEVALRSGIGRSAAQRFLYTLNTLGYLVQDPASRHYRLSSQFLTLTQSYVRADVLREKASPILDEANRVCEETVNLTVLDGTEVIYILRFPSKHVVSVNLRVGTRLPAFCTAPGRALLAHLGAQEAEARLAASRLARMTDATEIRPDRLRRILQDVRRRGYALSNQEAFVGDISVAAPVFDERGQAVAAVNIAVPYPRWSVDQVRRKLIPLVKGIAERVSAVLGAPL